MQNTVKLYREGRLEELRTRERKPLKPLKPAQIRAIRRKWGASQAIFADVTTTTQGPLPRTRLNLVWNDAGRYYETK